jgi:anti-sigma factor RsiW
MSLSRDVMMELMAYADGELEPAEMARVERLIAANADAKRLVESMGVLGRAVVEMHEAPHAAATDGLVDEIMARVEKEGLPRKSSMRPPKVVDLRDRRENRVKVVGAVIAMVALAAGIVVTTRKANEDTPSRQVATQPTAPGKTASPVATPTAPGTAAGGGGDTLATAGVDVEQVDSNRDVQVFYLPSSVQANASSVVVWIDDNGAGK